MIAIIKTSILILATCVKLFTMDNTEPITTPQTHDINNIELEDVSVMVMKMALEAVKEKIDLQLIGEEHLSIYNGVSEERITELEEALHMASIDYNYNANPVDISGKDREILEALVYGEAGQEGFVGQCLVAQCIRDTMSRMDTTNTKKIIKKFKYAGSIKKGT